MALVTVQRSPTPSNSPDEENTIIWDEVLSNECICSSTTGTFDSGQRSAKFLSRQRSLSECYFTVKGAAVILPQNHECNMMPRQSSSTGGDIQLHLQAMLHILRPQDTLKMAVRLQRSLGNHRTTQGNQPARYMAIVSTTGRQDNVESVILGIDYVTADQTTIGLVLPIWASTLLFLDGDGGINVESSGSQHVFKPVSVQAMWSAFQSLHKEHAVARDYTYFPGGLTHTWVQYYEAAISSPEALRSEWHYTFVEDTDQLTESLRDHCFDKPPERAAAEKLIRVKLKDIMQSVDLDEVTSKDIREKLEEGLQFSLSEYKEFIDQEMLVILGQMDKPSQIFPFLYLGTEWNASNWDELRQNSVGYIVNVTKEVDNFFPGLFYYMKIRVSDEESAELLKHWDSTFRFIAEAKDKNSAVLVHCKKGISRSSSTVIAYAMKEYGWSVEQALEYVKEKRNCITPNKGFMEQLKTYQGILDASRNRNSHLWNKITVNPPQESEQLLVPWDGVEDPQGHSSPDGPNLSVNGIAEFSDWRENNVVYTDKLEKPPAACGFPNMLVASENILKPFPIVSSQDMACSSKKLSKETAEKSYEEPECLPELGPAEIDEDDLPQVSHRPPVQRTLQSVEQKIRNRQKQPDQLSLKDMQVLLTRKGKTTGDKNSTSGASCSESSSLASTSGDESEFTPDQSREGSASFKSKRRNSKSSSGESTGDSAVAELGVISSSPRTEEPTWLSEPAGLGSKSQWAETQRPRGLSAPADPEKSADSNFSHNRARKIFDRLLLRSTSTEPAPSHSGKHSRFPIFKPGTKWYVEVGKIAGSCRSRPKSEEFSGDWSGCVARKEPSIKVAQPGNVKSQREKLERLSLESTKPKPKLKVNVSEVSCVKKIKHDLQSRATSSGGSTGQRFGKRVTTNSEENILVRSLVGVFEKPRTVENLTADAGTSGEEQKDTPKFYVPSGDEDVSLGGETTPLKRWASLRTELNSPNSNNLDSTSLRSARSLTCFLDDCSSALES